MWQALRISSKNECSKTKRVLSVYIDRRLSPEETAQVEEHLSTCRRCQEDLGALRATVALLHRLPEVTPSRSFAVAPVKPLPGQRALPALRFATAGAILLLVLAFAANRTGLFEGGMLSSPKYGADTLDFGPSKASEKGDSYWVVAGAANTLGAESETPVELVVPDGSDNVVAAVESLTSDGIVRANVVGTQLALTEGDSEAVAQGELTEFVVVSDTGDTENKFATNDSTSSSALNSIIKDQEGPHLNILSSDNNVLYSFPVDQAKREVRAAGNSGWLLPLECGLIGLVAVLGGATVALWLRQRRARMVEVSERRN